MRGIFTIITLVTISKSMSMAQVVTVRDAESGKPVELATIASREQNTVVTTDEYGKADISDLEGAGYMEIRHVSYRLFKTSFEALKAARFTVFLRPSELAIGEVVISANKWEQSIYEVPRKIIAITDKDAALANPQTSADLLAATGEVFVQKSQYGGGSPKLRGFAANSVLMVIDGVRMNNAIYRSGNLQNSINIDPNTLEGAEVVLGPGSVIYGSDALGGVMDFHTRRLSYADSGRRHVSGRFMSRYSSAAGEESVHGSVKFGWKKLATYTSFSYSRFGDLRSGSNRPKGYSDFGKRSFYVARDTDGRDVIVVNEEENVQVGSAFGSRNFLQKVGYRWSNAAELTYGFYYSTTSDIPRYDRLTETRNGIPTQAQWYYGPQRWLMHHVKWSVVRRHALFNRLKLIAAYQQYEESRIDRGFRADGLRTRAEEVAVYSLNADVDKEFKKGSLFYGVELLWNDVVSRGMRENMVTGEISAVTPRYPDGGSRYWSYAAYANYKRNITDCWVVSGGLRYSRVKLEAALTDKRELRFPFDQFMLSNNALNGSFGIVYSVRKNLKWNASLASGFRSPNIDDVGKVFDFSDGELQVPNPDLQPELTYNVEMGMEVLLGNKWEWGIAGFYTWLKDAVVRRDFTLNGEDSVVYDGRLAKVVSLTNTGRAVIYGVSVETEYAITHRFGLKGTLTWVDGEDRAESRPLRHTTPIFGRVSLDYKHKGWRLSLFSDFNGARFRKDIPASEIDDKSYLYAVHDSDASLDGSPAWVTFSWKGTCDLTDRVRISGGVENVFDVHYRPYSSGISAPGRNFIVALRAFIR